MQADRVQGWFYGWLRAVAAALALTCLAGIAAAQTQITAFRQAVAEAASKDAAIAAFYRETDYAPVWTARDDASRARIRAFLAALADAGNHALPRGRYDLDQVKALLASAHDDRELGLVEVEMSRLFLLYARDLQTGILTPGKIDKGLVMEVPLRDRKATLAAFVKSQPSGFLATLPPSSPEYARLMREKLKLEALAARGGWGPRVAAESLKPGASGGEVVVLRNRLMAMGYLGRTASPAYDQALTLAVQAFQADNGITPDGVAGKSTIAEINRQVEDRLASIVVAMERERWMNSPRGDRYIWVNEADFTAQIRDFDRVTFETRAVDGQNTEEHRSPEFSDQMEYLVVNPSWNVPRSIAVKEYLPLFQEDPNAEAQLTLIDTTGRAVQRDEVDFSQYTPQNFPFALQQAPSDGNALGLVKFMFPNKNNIYLHDTPMKSLFKREVRAFSHGCIRLADPFDFAYTLLSAQSRDPKGLFASYLNPGVEAVLYLDKPVPVHLTYRTAFTNAKGHVEYRRDIYGRDRRIFDALVKAGVVLGPVRG